MRESLAKLKASLEQEKRLNASIKQKKVHSDKLLFHNYAHHLCDKPFAEPPYRSCHNNIVVLLRVTLKSTDFQNDQLLVSNFLLLST